MFMFMFMFMFIPPPGVPKAWLGWLLLLKAVVEPNGTKGGGSWVNPSLGG
jgi:hypothetical protein